MMNFQMCFINVMDALLMHASLNSPPPQLVQQVLLPPQRQAQRQLNVSFLKSLYRFLLNIITITIEKIL